METPSKPTSAHKQSINMKSPIRSIKSPLKIHDCLPQSKTPKSLIQEPRQVAPYGSKVPHKLTTNRSTCKALTTDGHATGKLHTKKPKTIAKPKSVTSKTVNVQLGSKQLTATLQHDNKNVEKESFFADSNLVSLKAHGITTSCASLLAEQQDQTTRPILAKFATEIDLNTSQTQPTVADWCLGDETLNESAQMSAAVDLINNTPIKKHADKSQLAIREGAAHKIYVMLISNAWRKQCTELQCLQDELLVLKRAHIDFKNRKLAIKTLLHVERNRNEKLSKTLRNAREDVSATFDSCKIIKNTIDDLNVEKTALEEQLNIREQKCTEIRNNIEQSATELEKTRSEQDDLRLRLNAEKIQSEILDNEVKKLVAEIHQLNAQRRSESKELELKMIAKNEYIDEMQRDIETMGYAVVELKNKELELGYDMNADEELELLTEVNNLRKEISDLRGCLNQTMAQRFKNYWRRNAVIYQVASFQILHCIAFCLLPSPHSPHIPKLPRDFFRKDALSLIKR